MSNRIHKVVFPLDAFLIVILLAACNLPGLGVEPREAIPSTEPTSPPEDEGTDSCLHRDWFMDRGDMDLLIGTLIPVPNIRLTDGAMALVLRPEGTFDYSGSMVLRADLKSDGSEYIEGSGVFSNQGGYTADESIITFDASASQSGILRWHAYANGQSIDMPGEEPTFSLLPAGAAPYRCTPGRLEIDTRSPSGGTVTMFFSPF
jgi:hypothetical protein